MEKKLGNLKEIKANLDNLSKDIKAQLESKADTNNEIEDKMWKMMSSVYNYVDYIAKNLYSSLDYCHERISKHENPSTHLPPILGPEKMENAIKKLGLDGDYSVQKRTVWANTKNGLVIEAEYKKGI